MADGVFVKLEGIDELKRAMADASAVIRKKAVRSALREAGKVIQAATKAAAPVIKLPTPTRKMGTVKKNIAVRVSKFARQSGDEGVYVNVRGIRGAARVRKFGKAGAKNPNDPYYWRFLELGTKFIPKGKFSFLQPAAEKYGEAAIKKFMQSVIPQIEKLNQKAGR